MVRASRTLPICLLVLSVLFSILADAALVKKSNSGLCHPPQSSWFERTKNYRAFDSLEACLHSGGQLPRGVTLASTNNSSIRQVNTNVQPLGTAGMTLMVTARTAVQRR